MRGAAVALAGVVGLRAVGDALVGGRGALVVGHGERVLRDVGRDHVVADALVVERGLDEAC